MRRGAALFVVVGAMLSSGLSRAEPLDPALPLPGESNVQQTASWARDAAMSAHLASQALDHHDLMNAHRQLLRASQSVDAVRMSLPAAALIARMDDAASRIAHGEPLDVLAELDPELDAQRASLPEDVIQRVERANAALARGDIALAVADLRDARARLAEETGQASVELAEDQLSSAREALEDGRAGRAGLELTRVPERLDALSRHIHLVPVRFDLRAATVAAEQGHYRRVDALLREAQSLSQGTELGTRLSSLIKAMRRGYRPTPDELARTELQVTST